MVVRVMLGRLKVDDGLARLRRLAAAARECVLRLVRLVEADDPVPPEPLLQLCEARLADFAEATSEL